MNKKQFTVLSNGLLQISSLVFLTIMFIFLATNDMNKRTIKENEVMAKTAIEQLNDDGSSYQEIKNQKTNNETKSTVLLTIVMALAIICFGAIFWVSFNTIVKYKSSSKEL